MMHLRESVRGAKEKMNLIDSIAKPAWAASFRAVTSKCENCHRSLTLRHLSAQKAGIKMHGNWYCSSLCFTAAAEKRFSSLLASGMEQANHVSRMPLGLSMISRGLLTSTQLREVVEEQKEFGGEIGELLMRRGFVSEKQVTAARAAQWGCPVYSVPKYVVRAGIQIPSTLLQIYSAIPLHYVPAKKLILMGFVNGVEYGLLYSIEQMTECKTQPCFVTPSDFQLQMQQMEQAEEQRADSALKEVTFEAVQSPAEMAAILCGYGVDLEADEAMIGKCREYLWARLKYASKEIDLLFKAA
jgi:hypothetical protein